MTTNNQQLTDYEHSVLTLQRRNRALKSAISSMKLLLEAVEGVGVGAGDQENSPVRRTSRRKLEKLRNDPVRFLRDSMVARRLATLARPGR